LAECPERSGQDIADVLSHLKSDTFVVAVWFSFPLFSYTNYNNHNGQLLHVDATGTVLILCNRDKNYDILVFHCHAGIKY